MNLVIFYSARQDGKMHKRNKMRDTRNPASKLDEYHLHLNSRRLAGETILFTSHLRQRDGRGGGVVGAAAGRRPAPGGHVPVGSVRCCYNKY